MLGLKRERRIKEIVPSSGAKDAPTLAVFGEFDHFAGSALRNSLCTHWRAIHAIADNDQWRGADAFIRWAPGSAYRLTEDLRRAVPRHVVNDTHFSCDKLNVQRVASAVLGYSSAVDPLTHIGPCVVKSRVNAAHDGFVTTAPLRYADAGKAYELLIDNRASDTEIVDYRLPIILGRIPLAYLKFRPLQTRFANDNSRVEIVRPEAVLSETELSQCIAFARCAGLEYGEIDVLRDRPSGRIYIVDANNTPYGPPNGLSQSDREDAIERLHNCIAPAFLT